VNMRTFLFRFLGTGDKCSSQEHFNRSTDPDLFFKKGIKKLMHKEYLVTKNLTCVALLILINCHNSFKDLKRSALSRYVT
jgi:hypothetical protein